MEPKSKIQLTISLKNTLKYMVRVNCKVERVELRNVSQSGYQKWMKLSANSMYSEIKK